jgi:DNA invertase Pin-like site-specific DNA recombinase
MESGNLGPSGRPELSKALALAKQHKATLICSRLDRVSRNHAFFVQLQESTVPIVFLDALGADKFTLAILSLVASRERENLISRTRTGLQMARERLKAEGRRLGNPRPAESLKRATRANMDAKREFNRTILPRIKELQELGITSYNRLALCLNKTGEKTRLGKAWTATAVRNVMLSQS